ncbi:unnamed protein product [Hydatigera taeniaeformis]|uniref:Iwr1 domain-containing protein n=1 Tax=Hydatigena taeniaeformis TaxID=6205 RepID=A0A0R3WZT8_HYDTA|nr:unnamed protein product [Hydatigera taeniaeformis]
MQFPRYFLLSVVLTLALHEVLASNFQEDVDKSPDIDEKILVGKDDPQDSKTLESAFKISNEDGNVQLKFWFRGEDDENDDGEDDVDSDNDNDGVVDSDDDDGGDNEDDGGDRKRHDALGRQYSSEYNPKFDRRRRRTYHEEDEDGERYLDIGCTRYGCFGFDRYDIYNKDVEQGNDLWRSYRGGGFHSRTGRSYHEDYDSDDNDKDRDD